MRRGDRRPRVRGLHGGLLEKVAFIADVGFRLVDASPGQCDSELRVLSKYLRESASLALAPCETLEFSRPESPLTPQSISVGREDATNVEAEELPLHPLFDYVRRGQVPDTPLISRRSPARQVRHWDLRLPLRPPFLRQHRYPVEKPWLASLSNPFKTLP
jgi:hypothetical protein